MCFGPRLSTRSCPLTAISMGGVFSSHSRTLAALQCADAVLLVPPFPLFIIRLSTSIFVLMKTLGKSSQTMNLTKRSAPPGRTISRPPPPRSSSQCRPDIRLSARTAVESSCFHRCGVRLTDSLYSASRVLFYRSEIRPGALICAQIGRLKVANCGRQRPERGRTASVGQRGGSFPATQHAHVLFCYRASRTQHVAFYLTGTPPAATGTGQSSCCRSETLPDLRTRSKAPHQFQARSDASSRSRSSLGVHDLPFISDFWILICPVITLVRPALTCLRTRDVLARSIQLSCQLPVRRLVIFSRPSTLAPRASHRPQDLAKSASS
ncbi:hypothetical protein BV20DRAFT_600594 [Pilatotrama ljubarskyi]|nr:hypothetical protein BV20DRAFT_600594 [Pilatotrama ljubarskyi]